jgi:hypothetical protein
MIIIIVLKLDSGVNIRIKIVIIVVLRPDSGVQLGQDSCYKLGESTQVDPSQFMDTNDYYHSFKARLES